MEYENEEPEVISTEIESKIQVPRKNRRGWFEWKFTVGNILEIILIISTAIIYITRLEAKQTALENLFREHMIQNLRDHDRFVRNDVYMAREMYDKEFKIELTKRLDSIESALRQR